MRVLSLSLAFSFVFVFVVVSFCHAELEVVGVAECADCHLNNFKTSHAFSGLHVTIDCKQKKGIKRIGEGEVDEEGKFKISLPREIVKRVMNLKKECYAQLHSAAAVPCPAHGGVEATKIVFKSQVDQKVVFAPAKALQFSTALCTSKLLWPYFEYPPLPKIDPWKKDWPKITFPPLESFGNPWSLPPTYKSKPKPEPNSKPLPPPLSYHKPPPVPTYKPKPKPKPPVFKPPTKPIPPPLYKPTPKTPFFKPLPPKAPVYKPLPPVKPVYKPPAMKPLPPAEPAYKPPVTEPLTPEFPLFPFPPFLKKPCPPFAKLPPKKFDDPKFGYFPKLPPFDGNP